MTVTMPQGEWIPNPDQLTATGAGILAVAGDALDAYGLGERFGRRLVSHGETIPWKITLDAGTPAPAQLLVGLPKVALGRVAEEMFQFQKGDIGSHDFLFATYTVEIVDTWPMVTSTGLGTAAQQDDEAIFASTALLWREAWVVFSALRALSLGGVTTNPPILPIVQDNIKVGPLAPKGPSGGNAGWGCEVSVQF